MRQSVIEKLKGRPYLADFTALYGAEVLNDPHTALQRMGQALAAFETESSKFHPFTSKYDYWLKGQATLTDQELRGLGLFNNPTKGNCSACHPSTSGDGVTPALFTDFSFDNLGLPRNLKIPSNGSATAPAYTPINSSDGITTYYDLGICGPLRDNGTLNLSGICGQFKVPTLRNIALTAPYFHNGQFATLSKAIGFYVRRDTNPEQFYPTAADGSVTKFNDLPSLYGGQFIVNINLPGSDAGYLGNVNTGEIPYNRVLGDQPALDADEINDMITFLCTLTDGYDPKDPDCAGPPGAMPVRKRGCQLTVEDPRPMNATRNYLAALVFSAAASMPIARAADPAPVNADIVRKLEQRLDEVQQELVSMKQQITATQGAERGASSAQQQQAAQAQPHPHRSPQQVQRLAPPRAASPRI